MVEPLPSLISEIREMRAEVKKLDAALAQAEMTARANQGIAAPTLQALDGWFLSVLESYISLHFAMMDKEKFAQGARPGVMSSLSQFIEKQKLRFIKAPPSTSPSGSDYGYDYRYRYGYGHHHHHGHHNTHGHGR